MKNNEILIFEKLNELLIRQPNKTQSRTHLQILVNRVMLAYGNQQKNLTPKMTKLDILDDEFKDDKNNPKSCNTERVKAENIKRELQRIIFNNNQIISDFLELGFIPVFKEHKSDGGRNNPSYYWLEIEKSDNDNQVIERENTINKVYYEHRDKSLVKISLFSKIFFDKNYELHMFSFKDILLIVVLMLGFLLTLFILVFSVIFMALIGHLLSIGLSTLIIYSSFFVLFFYTFYYFYIPLNKIVTHRIVKAPLLFKSLTHDNAEIEFFGKTKDYKYNIARITEIRAVCPICTAPILLMNGKPDQSAPLVGRCIEAPHAHVYSFDRVLMTGYFLGHSMYLQEQPTDE